jgi:peptide/nickel transport system substrate-binding protein
MRRLNRLLVVSFSLVLLGMLVFPAFAQEGASVGPGEGGPIIWPNFGGDIKGLNPLLISDGPSQRMADRLFPTFIGISPTTGVPEPGVPGSLVTDWTVSEDGLVYTFTLRDDRTWSDGTPITSADIQYAFDAIVSEEIDSPLLSYMTNVESLETPDPQTVVITFKEADCTAVETARIIPPVPAHLFNQLFGTDYASMNTAEYSLNPTVTAGAFQFSNFRPGEQVTLLANQEYPDSSVGYVVPEGLVYKNYENQTVIVDAFLNGEITWIDSVPEDREAEIRSLVDAGEVQFYENLSSGWQFIGFNLADPANPQDGLDEEGNVIDQGHHPIFGDVRVRQAFALGINYDDLNTGAFSGSGMPIYSPIVMDSWAYNDALEPWPYDPEQAMALLDDAGWVDDDNNPDTPRVAQGALYAADGTPLSFQLTTFTGNTSVDNTAVLVQDQLRRIGFDVQLDIIEFNSMLEKLDGQTFDAIMLFYGGFVPSNPDEIRELFIPEGDVVGSGFNSTSYNNPEFNEVIQQAKTLPGCDQAERKALYDRAQEILREDLPFYFVNTSLVPVVVQNNVENWNPTEHSITYNMPAWTIQLE